MSDKSHLGPYGRRARLNPSLLALLPAAVFVFSVGWASDRAVLGSLGALVAQAGVPVLLAYMPRHRGQRVQARLWAEEPMPTTRRLRLVGADNAHLVEAAHAGLGKLVPEVQLPTAAEERAFPDDADQRYEAAVFSARDRLRDTPAGALVFDENCMYGFHRNLRAIREIAIFVASAVVVASVVALVLALVGAVNVNGWLLAIGLLLEAGMVIFWNVYPTDERVVASAEDYAEAFIRALAAAT